jgi:hypothetical protein
MVADMAALLSTIDTEPLSDPHSQYSILPAPQADVGPFSPSTTVAVDTGANPFGSTLLSLPEDFILPYASSAPSPDPHADDFIDPLLQSVFNPADGASSVNTHVGTHPSIEPNNVRSALRLPSSASPDPSSPVAAIPGGVLIDNPVLSLVHSPLTLPPSSNECPAATSYSTSPLAALPGGTSIAAQISSPASLHRSFSH